MAIIRLHNPRKAARRSARRTARRAAPKRRRKNLAGIGGVLTYMANPRRRKRSSNKARRRVVRHRARSRTAPMRRRSRRSNPRRRRNATIVMRNRHHRRRRNPGFGGGLFGNLGGLAIDSAFAIGGGVTTRTLPQLVLPNQNSGVMGYGLNILAAVGGSAAITKFTKNARYGGMFLLGGIVMTFGRVVDDIFGTQLVSFAAINPGSSPVLSGDSTYDMRVYRRLSGSYQPSNFPLPTNPLLTAGPAPAAASAGMGWASRGYNRRAYN